MKKYVICGIFLCFAIFVAGSAFSGEEQDIKELLRKIEALERKVEKAEKLETRIVELEKKLINQAKELEKTKTATSQIAYGKEEKKTFTEQVKRLSDAVRIERTDTADAIGHPKRGIRLEKPKTEEDETFTGLKVHPYMTVVVQGTPKDNKKKKSKFNASGKFDLDLEKDFGDWGLAFVELEMGQGDGLESDLHVFGNVNNNANDTDSNAKLNKYWYQQHFFNKQMTIVCGKLDPTDWFQKNKFQDDDSSQFLARPFNKSLTVEWPTSNGFGAHLALRFKEFDFVDTYFNFYEGDSDWRNILDHGIYVSQVKIKPEKLWDLDPDQWSGNYRFYSWINSRNHTKLVDVGSQASDDKEMSYGFGLSFDQSVTDVYGLFCRFGWQRPDVAPAEPRASSDISAATIEWSWSAGAQMTGKHWRRESDILAFSVGQLVPSREYKDAGNSGGAEGHFETYYKWQVNRYLGISPSIQLIWNPYGESDDVIFIYATRAHVSF